MPTSRGRFFCLNMDNSRPSFGPGSNTLGGADGVSNAMANPGGVAQLQTQVSPSSAIFNPAMQQPNPLPMPQGSPMSQFSMQAAMAPQPQQPVSLQQQPQAPQAAQPPKGESHAIVEALTKRLSDLGKLEHSLYGVQ